MSLQALLSLATFIDLWSFMCNKHLLSVASHLFCSTMHIALYLVLFLALHVGNWLEFFLHHID